MKINLFTQEPLSSIITRQIKAPLVLLLNAINSQLPEPTRETVRLPNSRILVDIRDGFFEHLNYPVDIVTGGKKIKALRAMWNLFIIVYDYDPPYRYAIDWVIEELVKRAAEWRPRPRHEPDERYWKHF